MARRQFQQYRVWNTFAILCSSSIGFDTANSSRRKLEEKKSIADHLCSENSNSRKFSSNVSKALISIGRNSALRCTSCEDLPNFHMRKTAIFQDTPEMKQYDFVVVGNGNAGRSAVETLRKFCPNSSIAVIDPLRPCTSLSDHSRYYPDAVVRFHPSIQTVKLLRKNETIKYKTAVLVATGARGAHPPSYLIDKKVQDRVLELRSTILSGSETKPLGRRIISSPGMVRSLVLQAASEGSKIAIIGSGWEAVELAVAARISSKKSQATLVFGARGPLNHILPQYLTAEVSKRLKKKSFGIQDRSVIRYIGGDDRKLRIFTGKSYDLLDSASCEADLVVVAPEVSGHMGSAVLSTNNTPSYLLASSEDRAWYQTWTQLTSVSDLEKSAISCYANDGRVVVNAELNAGTGVYAAGSAAKYPNWMTGHADVAGIGSVDGKEAGQVAAMNMCHDFVRHGSFPRNGEAVGPESGESRSVKDPIPVWRSDVNSYIEDSNMKMNKSVLEKVGIRALCVGNCDSETCSTHALWWTNQAALARLRRTSEDDKQALNQWKKYSTSSRPVYGFGVIYYIDSGGKIQGVMTWGFPYTTNPKKLNMQLLARIKQIIINSKGTCIAQSESDRIQLYSLLEEESRKIAVSAFQENAREDGSSHQLNCSAEHCPRPLLRFTDARPSSARNMRVLKRNDGRGRGIMEEDLFSVHGDFQKNNEGSKEALSFEEIIKSESYARETKKVESMRKWALWEEREIVWDNNEDRSRPPKEELLWLRKGDENRIVSRKDKEMSAIKNHVSNTKFY